MARILILFSTTDGHTVKICERLQERVERDGHQATLVSIADAPGPDLRAFDKIVIGASIRNGKHNPAVVDFIRANQALLENKPSAFFSVNLVARKPAKNTAETNPYVKAFIARSPWKPRLVGVFGGDLDYQRYGFMDRHIIRLIMTITGGPTDLQTKVDYTDWEKVRAFAGQVAAVAPERPS